MEVHRNYTCRVTSICLLWVACCVGNLVIPVFLIIARSAAFDQKRIRVFRSGPDPGFLTGARSLFRNWVHIRIFRSGPDPYFLLGHISVLPSEPDMGWMCVFRLEPDPHIPIGARSSFADRDQKKNQTGLLMGTRCVFSNAQSRIFRSGPYV